MTAACRFFSYGLEKNFRPDVYEEFEKRTLQVRCYPPLFAACTTYANDGTCSAVIFFVAAC